MIQERRLFLQGRGKVYTILVYKNKNMLYKRYKIDDKMNELARNEERKVF